MGKAEAAAAATSARPGGWASPLHLKPTTASRSAIQSWPTQVEDVMAWEPADLQSGAYVLALTDDDVIEIHMAMKHFNALGLYGSEVSADNFPLPALGKKLRNAALDVHRGCGIALVRGISPDDFSQEENVLIFLGLSSYIGPERGRQDEEGNMLIHIRDAKLSKTCQQDRPTRYSKRASTFHTDTFCDILALQTRRCAAVGGRNILSSSWTIYNKLAAKHPDVVELLAQPIWPFDSRGTFFKSGPRPLLFHHDNRILLNFAREPLLGLDGIRRAAGLATLTQVQRDALDILERTATESQIVLDAQPGDLLFINNHAVLHSREAFEDYEGSVAGRYLVRMWLRNEELAWELPGALREGHDRIYGDNEIGERWNVVDVPRVRFRLSERLTS